MERPTRPTSTSTSDHKGEKLKNEAVGMAEDAKRQAREQAHAHKQTAADQTDRVAAAVDRVAEQLHQEDQQTLAEYAGQLAGEMKSFAENLRGRSVDELLRDTQQFARRNPAAFFLGSVAVGFALTRFAKASATSTRGQHDVTGVHAASTSPPAQPPSEPRITDLKESNS